MAAAYNNIGAYVFKELLKPLTCANSHKTVFINSLGFWHNGLLTVADAFSCISVLIAHIIYFNVYKLAVFKRRLNNIARLI